MFPRLAKGTPSKSRQVWACLGVLRHNQLKVVVSHATFLWRISPCTKQKKLMHYYQRQLMIKEFFILIGQVPMGLAQEKKEL